MVNQRYEEARRWMDSGNLEEAAKLFEGELKTDPHFKDLELLGECLLHLGRLAEAIVPLAAATTLNRGVRAPCLLAEVFVSLGQIDNARQMAELVLNRAPTNRTALKIKQQATDELTKST